MAGRYDQKKPGASKPDQQQEQEQEVQQEQEQTQEQEQKRGQASMGNQAIAAMLNARADPSSPDADGGGASHSVRRSLRLEKEGVDYGGEDPIDDVPINLDDLARSWNPTTRKSEDRPRFVEPMPDDDLPPEDPHFLERAYVHPSSGSLPRLRNIDALLQPSPQIVARSMAGWARAAARWSSPELSWRAVGGLIRQNASLLQDPDARVLPARAALGALGACLLAESPPVRARPTVETGALIEFCLELEGRAHRVDNLVVELEGQRSKLPRAAALLSERLPPSDAELQLVEPRTGELEALTAAIDALVRWEPTEPTIPELTEPEAPSDNDEDPLGLDDFMIAELGGPIDPKDALYKAGLQTAERLAAGASLTRIGWSAAAVLIAEVAQLWSRAPVANLIALGRALDEAIDGVLKLLLEVARACQKRMVEPRGIRNGLRRGARKLDDVRRHAVRELATLCATLLPGRTDTALPRVPRPDPLHNALQEGHPEQALDWLTHLPASFDRDVTTLIVRVIAGLTPTSCADEIHSLRERALAEATPGPIVTVLTILLAHAHRHLADFEQAITLGEAMYAVGRARRSGLLVAEGALMQMECLSALSHLERAEDVRLTAGRLCIDLGARGALSLLARWTPSEPEPEDFTPFFDYPLEFDDEADEG